MSVATAEDPQWVLACADMAGSSSVATALSTIPAPRCCGRAKKEEKHVDDTKRGGSRHFMMMKCRNRGWTYLSHLHKGDAGLPAEDAEGAEEHERSGAGT